MSEALNEIIKAINGEGGQTSVYYSEAINTVIEALNGNEVDLKPYLPTPVASIVETVGDKAFYVWHSSMAGGGTNGKPERIVITDEIATNGYDLTSHIPYGCLYGGYALADGITKTGDPYNGANWQWTTMQTASGLALVPTEGETYYVKEIPRGYLTFRGYKGGSGGVLNAVYFLSCYDLVPGTPSSGSTPASIDINAGVYINGEKHEWSQGLDDYWTISGYRFDPSRWNLPGGWISLLSITSKSGDYTSLMVENGVIYTQPYFITKDNVEVKGQMEVSELRSRSFANDPAQKVVNVMPLYQTPVVEPSSEV